MTVGAAVPLSGSRGDDSWLRRAGPVLLVAGSAGSAHLFRVFGLALSADRILGLAAVAVLAVLVAQRRLRWTPVHSALALFVAIQLLTTASSAATWTPGPKFVGIYVMGFACFALAAEVARGTEGERRMALVWIGVGVAVSAVGVVSALLANVLQSGFWGSGKAQLLVRHVGRPRILYASKATFNEWNLFSSFLLIPFAIALWSWRREAAGRAWLVGAIGAMAFGLVFGVTRAAWIAVAGLAGVAWWLRRLGARQVAALALIFAAALGVQALVVGATPVRTRVLEPIAEKYDWNMAGRWAISRATLESWLKAPLLGHGAGSINDLTVTLAGGAPLRKVWNGNIVLFVLHDSGILGLAALLGVAGTAGLRAVRAIRGGAVPGGPRLAVPLLAAGGALCFAYQFTHGLWLMYPYVYLGFLTAATEAGPGAA